MLHYFRWNDGTVILNLNQHFFRFVAINLNVDLSVRLITDCLNRIFQKINDYLRNQILICMQDQVGRIDLCMERDVVTRILMAGKFHHSFDECFQVKQ